MLLLLLFLCALVRLFVLLIFLTSVYLCFHLPTVLFVGIYVVFAYQLPLAYAFCLLVLFGLPLLYLFMLVYFSFGGFIISFNSSALVNVLIWSQLCHVVCICLLNCILISSIYLYYQDTSVCIFCIHSCKQ